MIGVQNPSLSESVRSYGATGGTGGPGGTPTSASENAPISPSVLPGVFVGEEDDPMRHLVMHFQGSTGAMGGTPDPNVQLEADKPVSQETVNLVRDNMTGQIEKLDKAETLRQLKAQNLAAEDVFGSARSKMLNIGYVIGQLLCHLKKLVIDDGENWGDYIQDNLPEMSRRSLDKYMNIANTPGILKHAYLGIDAAEKVIQTIAPIKHMLSKEDPIGDLFSRNGITVDYSQVEKGTLKGLVKGVISREKLLKKGIEIEVQVAIDFSNVAGAITAVDIAVMIDRMDHGLSPQKYMEEVIANNGTRPNDVSDVTTSKKPIHYINAETVKLKNSIERLLDGKSDLKKVDRTHLEALSKVLDSLLEQVSK